MIDPLNRRSFLKMGVAFTAAAAAPRWILAQSAPSHSMIDQARATAANTPVKTTRLYDNLYLLQGAGGNMALQTGPQANILIDASYATAVPHILDAMAAVTKDAPGTLINTHWHFDHTDGNAGLHAAGFQIVAHQKTRDYLSQDRVMKAFQLTVPASPASALPEITFESSMHLWHNGDSLDLVHFEPAHTDSDIYIHFHNADTVHLGDIFFNGFYPFIDESTGGSIGGMIRGAETGLAVAGNNTRIIPGHGPLASKADLQKYRDMLAAARDKVAALKSSGLTEQETIAKKPTAGSDPIWGRGFMNGDTFAGLVYRTL
jgi:glyoxylase-like metal-dependent hydrolase (beta-lactamase superfamily II)